MSHIVPKPTREQIPTRAEFPDWAHPLNLFYESEWMLLRDCMIGEKQVKSRTTEYIPKMNGFDTNEYANYVDRATFYNMVARTVSGMLGTLFRRNPIVSNVPSNIDLDTIGFEKDSLWTLMRDSAQEVIHVGRLGGLVDMASEGSDPNPYIVLYPVESIINWTYGIVDNRKVPVEIILREIKEYKEDGRQSVYRYEYRKLSLENKVYRQYVYKSSKDRDADIHSDMPEVITPTRRGKTLESIPFEFINTSSNKAEVERPTLIDVGRLNISHFRSSAHLEHGRYYTGQPIYYCSADSNDKTEFTLGPSVVWKLPQEGKAGIIEFNGTGLKTLKDALEEKESQAASLGGRLIGVSSQSTAESDNMTAMKERNENAILLNIAFALETAFTRLLRYVAWWKDNSESAVAEIEVECSKDFMMKPVGAREFRAMHMMYTDGLIPVESMYDYLRRAEVIPDWMEFEEFVRLLKSSKSFPGQPDAEARMKGYPDARSMLQDEFDRDELEHDAEMQDSMQENAAKEADKARKFQEKQADKARKAQEQASKRAAQQQQTIGPKAGERRPTDVDPQGKRRPPNRN